MSTATSTSTGSAKAGCVESPSLFQHPLLEDPPTGSASAEQRRQHQMLTRKAKNLCHECPLLTTCLYDAVVNYDVAGFAAATTERQRREIRNRLGITVAAEDLDTLAGVIGRYRQVDHDEVVRIRYANPHDTLETLAHRLGCSLSTVKRHLRRHRHKTGRPDVESRPRPTPDVVYAAFCALTSPVGHRRAA